MLQSIIQSFATFGGFLFSICVVFAGACAIAFCTGLLFEQFAKVFNLNDYKAVGNGLKTGALGGMVFSIFAIYQLGNFSALFSLIGLSVALLVVTGVTALIKERMHPYIPNPEFE
ncbi:hypothetical protein BH10CYA1_BH10CYA1_28620 [soil metagenome]